MSRWKKGQHASTTLDRRDKLHLLEVYGPILKRCICGRLKVDGYICLFCDDENGYCWGEEPKDEEPDDE